jgi:hypothetical protein
VGGGGRTGALDAFSTPPCATGSGWAGDGTPENPHRLSFDGIDDAVSFGAINSLDKQTVIVWARRTGQGTAGLTGTGGIQNIFPLITKGTAEAEMVAVDINYYLGWTPGGRAATDYEQSTAPISGNNPLTGNSTLLDDTWYAIGMTFDYAASSRVLYVNGKSDGTSATTAPPSAGSTSLLVVGGSNRTDLSANGRFKGDIAIVLTYDRALSVTEIEQNCHAYSSRFGIGACPNP